MGYFIVIAASILFGIFPSIQKNVLACGVTPIALVIVCNSIACILALLLSLIQKKSIRVDRKQLISLILIGVLGLFTTDYLLDIAYTLIPVGYVTMIHFLYPTLVCASMCLFFHQKLTVYKGAAIALSVAGLILLAGGSFSGSILGIVVAGITSLSFAFYMIATDKTAAGKVDPMVRVFYTNLAVSATACIFSTRMEVVMPQTPALWLECLLIGAMLFGATFLLNEGVKRIGAGSASFANMVEPVTSLVVSSLIYHYSFTALAILGCILIIGSLAFSAKD